MESVAPSEANWYWEVIYEDENGETQHADGYAIDRPDMRKVRSKFINPIETNVSPTPNNPKYRAPKTAAFHYDGDMTYQQEI
jgi:hypothetical protein